MKETVVGGRTRSALLASGMSLAMLASTMVAIPALAAPRSWKVPAAQHQPSIAVHAVTAGSTHHSQVDRYAVSGQPAVSWPKPGTATVAPAAADAVATRAGSLPVAVRHVPPSRRAGSATPVAKASVRVLGHAASRAAAGTDAVVLQVSRADGDQTAGPVQVRVDYAGFARAGGGGYGSRLRLVQLPACALTTPQAAGCQQATVLPTVNDAQASTLTATVHAAAQGTVLAAEAGPSGGTGNYAATKLSPSATWSVSQQTGDFSWSYPLTLPPAPAGAAPQVEIAYESQGVDGRTAATNNQASWIGDGWDLWPGYIERSYKACDDDTDGGNNAGTKVGDQCWATDNAMMTLNGHATDLVKDDDSGTWRPKDDDGSRIQHLTGASNGDNDGEYWRVTTTDGTQYYFGRNRLPGWASGDTTMDSAWTMPVFGNNAGEPCHADSFDSSDCSQAWRWNLDYVVDAHGNAISYRYRAETGHYGKGGDASDRTAYVRGGSLAEIDYGFTDGHAYDIKPGVKVSFGVVDRCSPGSTCDTDHPASWPDTPWDQDCLTAPCTGKTTPVFFTSTMLSTVTTQVLKGSSYADVDRWTLVHEFLDPGDNDAKPLWLKSITHTGLNGGTQSLPAVTFDGTQMDNRVDTSTDGLSALIRYRLTAITSETGSVTTIGYSSPQCKAGVTMPSAPDSDTLRCMPTYWYPPGEDKKLDYFHKYVVTEVRVHDSTGGAPDQDTRYAYQGSPAWHYNDNDLVSAKLRTWSQWRGYNKVLVTEGVTGHPRSETLYTYLRGMDGDHQSDGSTRSVSVTDSQGGTHTDSPQLEGFQLEQQTHDDADGTTVEDTITTPWTHGPTATQNHDGFTVKAWMVDTGTTATRSLMSDGSWGIKKTATTYNDDGFPTQVDDQGDTSSTADDQCTRTTYTTRNTTDWILGRPAEVELDATRCANTATPDQVISASRSYYDGSTTLDAPPTAGDVTKTEGLTDWNGNTPVYTTDSTTSYDPLGRAVASSDALGRTTTTGFTPADGGPVTQTQTTDALDHTVTTTLDPATGQTLSTVDANGRRTDVSYDPLGRVSAAWLPGRTKGTDDANVVYSYAINNDAPSVVTTQSLVFGTVSHSNTLHYTTSYALYDSLLRIRQTQKPAPGGGRAIEDTFYDERGLVAKTTQPYFNADPPSATLVGVDGQPVTMGDTAYTYDGQQRQTAAIVEVGGHEKWRTSTAYPGADRTDVTPPAGATPTSSFVDARGNTTQIRQYHGGAPTGDYDTTNYTYTPAGNLAGITDAAGNEWSYTYDTRGYRVKASDPDTGTSTMAYDNAGELTSTTDARGTTIAYSYDDLGRKTGEYENSTSGTKLAEWDYDTLPGGIGLPAGSTRYIDGHAYTETPKGYDAAGRPTGTSVTIPDTEGALAGTYTDTTTYNPDGSPATITLPAAGDLKAEQLLYRYDELGEPTTMFSSLTNYVYARTYDFDGTMTQRVLGPYGTRLAEDYLYDPGTRRMTGATATPELKTAVANLAYTYDPAGNITKAVDTTNNDPDTQCFGYDYLDRLTDAWTPASPTDDSTAPGDCGTLPTSTAQLGGPAAYWHTYSYDATGNRTGLVEHLAGGDTTVSSAYPKPGQSHPHALSSTTTTSSVAAGSTATEQNLYSYDAAGNTTSRTIGGDTQTLTWDSLGEMTAAKDAGGATTGYLYDADGTRLIRHDPDGTATLWLPDGTELRASGGTVKATRYYTDSAGDTIAVRTAAGLTWMVNDPNGTNTVQVDAKTLTAAHRYADPFGQPRSALPDWIGDHGYVDGIDDPATGLTRLGARDYDPSLGRFISADPIADPSNPQQLNGYAYASNSPVIHNDASGEILACGGLGGSDPHLGCRDGSTHPNGNNAGPVNWGWSPGSNSHPYDYQGRHGTTLRRHRNGSYSINGVTIYDGPKDALAFAKAVDAATANWANSHKTFDPYNMSLSDVLNMMEHACVPESGTSMCSAAFTNELVQTIQGQNAERIQSNWKAGDKIVFYAAAGLSIAAAAAEGAGRGGGSRPRGGASDPLGGCHSFTGNTRVGMADGATKPISKIKIGDEILNADPQRGKDKRHRVDSVIVTTSDHDLVDLSVATEKGTGIVTTTRHHRIWDATAQRWTEASKLQVGHHIQSVGGKTYPVAAVRLYSYARTTYDLTVDRIHTYYVRAGDTSVLVHNCARTPSGRRGVNFKNLSSNGPTTIDGRDYTGHAINRMQERGIMPSVVENTIRAGSVSSGKRPGTSAYYEPENDITVIVDTTSGRVVTVSSGRIQQ